MGLKNCQIQLDNPWNTYYAGQTINGQVVLTFDAPKKVRGIVIKVRGYSEVYTDNNCNSRDMPQAFKKEQTFKIYKSYIMGSEDAREVDFEAGEHKYKFDCFLPENLPSSFKEKKCYIKYYVEMNLHYSAMFSRTEKHFEDFKIVNHIDLNLDPELRLPLNSKMQTKFFSPYRCCTGPLTFQLHLPMTGFIPSTKIPIKAECKNESDVNIKSVKIILRQRIENNLRHGNTAKTKLSEINLGSVGGNETKTFDTDLTIPPFHPLKTLGSNILFTHYEQFIRLNVNIFHRDLRGRIPVVIGTVPIDPNFQPPLNFKPELLQHKPRKISCWRRQMCYVV